MKLTRTKKLVFCNNKGGVGKTTLAFNCAVSFAKAGYKTVLIDLDPQCNLSLLSLGYSAFEDNLFSSEKKDISDVLKGIVEGGGDIDSGVSFQELQENLSILQGSLKLALFEDLLVNASFNLTASGQPRGFVDTSAIDRFLREKGLNEKIDIFVIDTSPNLGMLNRIAFLGADYFVVPMMPDAFSVQGIENLGIVFEKWKKEWDLTAKALVTGDIPQKNVLPGGATFIGYIINSYNVYSKRPIKRHRDWIEKIPLKVKKFLSEKHSRNGLVESSQICLQIIQDYGQLTALCQEKTSAIFDLDINEVERLKIGTKKNVEKSRIEFKLLSDKIIDILEKY